MAQTAWPFDRFHHVHLATKDMSSVERFLRPLGLPLGEYNHPGKFIDPGDMDEEEFWAADYKFCRTKTGHVQFMSPHKPGGYRDFLNTHGNRVYSLGFEVDDADAAEAELVSRGLEVRVKGRHEDGWGFTYFDTLEKLGVYLCVRQSAANEAKSANSSSSGAFSTLHHVHIVVDDMDDVQRFLEGIGIVLSDYPHPGRFKLLEGLDEAAFWKLGYKHAECGPIHLQVMSPADEDTGHKRFAAQYGRRVFSVGFVVDEIDRHEERLKSNGLEVLMKGRHEDGWGFTYFDTFRELGVNLCIRCNPEASSDSK